MQFLGNAMQALFAAAVLTVGATSAVQAQALVTQDPCTSANRYCYRFVSGAAGPATVRSIKALAPGPGRALVTMNGTGFCTNDGNSRGAVAFEAQIVNRAGDPPSATGPGGAIYSFTLEQVSGDTPNATHALNLNLQRVFNVPSAARRSYFFRIVPTRMDPNITCDLYNMSFTVLFTD